MKLKKIGKFENGKFEDAVEPGASWRSDLKTLASNELGQAQA